jgi:hypothetical protein
MRNELALKITNQEDKSFFGGIQSAAQAKNA